MDREYVLTHTCRLCFRPDVSSIYLNIEADEDVKKMILSFFPCVTLEDQNLPVCVCDKCLFSTSEFYRIWKNQPEVQSEFAARLESSDFVATVENGRSDEPECSYQSVSRTPSRNAGRVEQRCSYQSVSKTPSRSPETVEEWSPYQPASKTPSRSPGTVEEWSPYQPASKTPSRSSRRVEPECSYQSVLKTPSRSAGTDLAHGVEQECSYQSGSKTPSRIATRVEPGCSYQSGSKTPSRIATRVEPGCSYQPASKTPSRSAANNEHWRNICSSYQRTPSEMPPAIPLDVYLKEQLSLQIAPKMPPATSMNHERSSTNPPTVHLVDKSSVPSPPTTHLADKPSVPSPPTTHLADKPSVPSPPTINSADITSAPSPPTIHSVNEPSLPGPPTERTEEKERIRITFQKDGSMFKVKSKLPRITLDIKKALENRVSKKKPRNRIPNGQPTSQPLVANGSTTSLLSTSLDMKSKKEGIGGKATAFRRRMAWYEKQKLKSEVKTKAKEIIQSLIPASQETPLENLSTKKSPHDRVESDPPNCRPPAANGVIESSSKLVTTPKSPHKRTIPLTLGSAISIASKKQKNDSAKERLNGAAVAGSKRQANNQVSKPNVVEYGNGCKPNVVENGNASKPADASGRNSTTVIECMYRPPNKTDVSPPVKGNEINNNHCWDMMDLPGTEPKKLYFCRGCKALTLKPAFLTSQECPSAANSKRENLS